MTGPAIGKIPLDAKVFLVHGNKIYEVPCDVYLHVKGYSLARVTHLDLEHNLLNELVKPKSALYVPFKVVNHKIIINLKKAYYLKSLKNFVSAIVIESNELCKIIGEISSMVYIGGKVGGVFLGFHKDVIRKLEHYAISKGYPPK